MSILELTVMASNIVTGIFYKISLSRRERRKRTTDRTEKAQRQYWPQGEIVTLETPEKCGVLWFKKEV